MCGRPLIRPERVALCSSYSTLRAAVVSRHRLETQTDQSMGMKRAFCIRSTVAVSGVTLMARVVCGSRLNSSGLMIFARSERGL